MCASGIFLADWIELDTNRKPVAHAKAFLTAPSPAGVFEAEGIAAAPADILLVVSSISGVFKAKVSIGAASVGALAATSEADVEVEAIVVASAWRCGDSAIVSGPPSCVNESESEGSTCLEAKAMLADAAGLLLSCRVSALFRFR